MKTLLFSMLLRKTSKIRLLSGAICLFLYKAWQQPHSMLCTYCDTGVEEQKNQRLVKLILWMLLSYGLLMETTVSAASLYAGKAKAAAVCSQCHGIRNISADAPFPSLAGRDENYLKTALKQYRDKTRVSDIMNNIAASLTDKDINNIASYYSRLKVE